MEDIQHKIEGKNHIYIHPAHQTIAPKVISEKCIIIFIIPQTALPKMLRMQSVGANQIKRSIKRKR